jgi:competence protein ComEA
MTSRDSSAIQRVNRILDAARASPAPEPDAYWPSSWPPGQDDEPAPEPPAGPVTTARWDVPGRAAVAIGILALLIIAIVVAMQVRGGSSPGTVVTGADSPFAASSTTVPSTEGPSTGLSSTAGPDTAVATPLPGGAQPIGSAAPGPAQPSTAMVQVYVVGQVKQPGVVSLAPGARVQDALNAAGGETDRADLTVMNLARKVVDGERILVPRPGEKVPTEEPIPPGAVSGAGAGTGGSTDGGGGAVPGSPVDLNTATVAELDALPGVGPVIAGRIVAWRQQNGNFKTVDDLGEVSGIGDATLEKLRPLVRV